jgi:drug/metabolite transporter (DMT)-like permease
LNSVIGILFFEETMSFYEIAGSVIIIGCCLLIVTYKRIGVLKEKMPIQ